MKVLILIIFLGHSFLVQANNWNDLYVSIVSSGTGGALLGHSYLLFCNRDVSFNLGQCQAVEFNLDINLGAKFEETMKLSSLEKYKALRSARFQVFIHEDARAFQTKYHDRSQRITYYQYSGSIKKINNMYANIKVEQSLRSTRAHYDYSINGNNCATKILEAFEEVEPHIDFFKSYGYFDFNQYLYQFPIFLQNVIEESGLFHYAIETSNHGWRAFKVQ